MVTAVAREFVNTKFTARDLKGVKDILQRIKPNEEIIFWNGSIKTDAITYSFGDTDLEEADFFDRFDQGMASISFSWRAKKETEFKFLYLRFRSHSTSQIQFTHSKFNEIQEVVYYLESVAASRTEVFESTEVKEGGGPTVFLGHGRSSLWKDLRDHLRDQHGYKVEAYETGTRAGHTIRDIVEEMATKSDVAFLVHTAEDELSNGKFQSRPNVIHETGLFQGKLGFPRAIVLLEEGCEEFSNLAGIQQIRFKKGNIREAFGDVLATLRREFGK